MKFSDELRAKNDEYEDLDKRLENLLNDITINKDSIKRECIRAAEKGSRGIIYRLAAYRSEQKVGKLLDMLRPRKWYGLIDSNDVFTPKRDERTERLYRQLENVCDELGLELERVYIEYDSDKDFNGRIPYEIRIKLNW